MHTPMGVSFSTVTVEFDELSCKFQVWDIDGRNNRENRNEIFCAHAAAGLLFFDSSNRHSFNSLVRWIELIRTKSGHIPIYIIGVESELGDGVEESEVVAMMTEHRLDGYYLNSLQFLLNRQEFLQDIAKKLIFYSKTSVDTIFLNPLSFPEELNARESRVQLHELFRECRNEPEPEINTENSSEGLAALRDEMLEELQRLKELMRRPIPPPPPHLPHPVLPAPPSLSNPLEGRLGSLREEMLAELDRLRRIMRGDDSFDMTELDWLTEEERARFEGFLSFFSNCPACGRANHKNYLRDFYFSSEPEKLALKEQLEHLMEEFQDDTVIFLNKINLGIPCCDCFKTIFGET